MQDKRNTRKEKGSKKKGSKPENFIKGIKTVYQNRSLFWELIFKSKKI